MPYQTTYFTRRQMLAALSLVYLLPVTYLYALLVFFYGVGMSGDGALLGLLWVFAYGLPLVALWTACMRLFDRHATNRLPGLLFAGLVYGCIVIASSALYAGLSYPWGESISLEPVFALFAAVGAPAVMIALLFIREHLDERFGVK